MSSIMEIAMKRFAFVVPAVVVGLFAPSRAFAVEHQKLHEALYDIRQAADELEKSDSKFGGHKKEAIEDLRKAATQVEKLLGHVKIYDPKFEPKPRDGKDFKHLRHAEKAIDEAIVELEKSKLDFGEHKEKALKDLRQAHKQVVVCIKELK